MTRSTRLVCPFDHPLGPEQAVVGWHPCQCPAALANHGGHLTWRCRACADAGRTTRRFSPPHQRTSAEVVAEMVPVQAEYERALAATELLGHGASPEATRAAERLNRVRHALEHMETVRATRSAARH